MRLALLLSAVSILSLSATPAMADVTNGDFEAGGSGWSMAVPARWTGDFPATGGNPDGNAHIQSPFGQSGGTGCVSQTFFCGQEDPTGLCTIVLEYLYRSIDASSLSGRVKINLDGTLVFTSPAEDFIDWTALTFQTSCGEHVLELCLEVDSGNNGVEALFDNVSADCTGATPTEPSRWGTVKTLYR